MALGRAAHGFGEQHHFKRRHRVLALGRGADEGAVLDLVQARLHHPGELGAADLHRLGRAIGGKVEAGAFREVDDLEDTGEEPELIFEEPDPDFPRAKRVAFTVEGDSMNAAVPPLLEGYRLICVDFEDADVPLSDGMTVVVQRTRDGGLTREWSVKEVELGETEISFCPRSTNPRHKPIVVPIDAEPDDSTVVQVIAIARSVSASIPRFRIKKPS